jgi:predicted Zn-dependent peptidase
VPSAPKGAKAFDTVLPAPRPRIVLVDRPQSPQSLILAGSVLPVTGRDDLLTLTAANEVVGNDFLSRINTQLREVRGWSYGVSGAVNLRESRTLYLINAPVQADRTGESIADLIEQYKGFLTDRGVTAQERDRTINGNTRRLAGSFERSVAILNAMRNNVLYNRPDKYWETVASRYHAMTVAHLDRAAREVIDPSRFMWVVVGDANVVRPQLANLGMTVEAGSAE